MIRLQITNFLVLEISPSSGIALLMMPSSGENVVVRTWKRVSFSVSIFCSLSEFIWQTTSSSVNNITCVHVRQVVNKSTLAEVLYRAATPCGDISRTNKFYVCCFIYI